MDRAFLKWHEEEDEKRQKVEQAKRLAAENGTAGHG
jgi:hypothetical protein